MVLQPEEDSGVGLQEYPVEDLLVPAPDEGVRLPGRVAEVAHHGRVEEAHQDLRPPPTLYSLAYVPVPG